MALVVCLALALAGVPDAPALVAPESGVTGTLVLVTGEELEARIAYVDARRVVARLPDGESRLFARAEIAGVRPPRLPRFSPEATVANLSAPSGRLVGARRLEVAARGVHLEAAGGVGEHLAVSVGTTVPILYASQLGANLRAEARGGLAFGQRVHLAAGLVWDVAASGHTTSYLSGAATFGWSTGDVTLYAGPTLPGTAERVGAGDVGVAAATRWLPRGKRYEILAEAWHTWEGDAPGHALLGARLRQGPAAFDLGVMTRLDRLEPVPWFGVTVGLPGVARRGP